MDKVPSFKPCLRDHSVVHQLPQLVLCRRLDNPIPECLLASAGLRHGAGGGRRGADESKKLFISGCLIVFQVRN